MSTRQQALIQHWNKRCNKDSTSPLHWSGCSSTGALVGVSNKYSWLMIYCFFWREVLCWDEIHSTSHHLNEPWSISFITFSPWLLSGVTNFFRFPVCVIQPSAWANVSHWYGIRVHQKAELMTRRKLGAEILVTFSGAASGLRPSELSCLATSPTELFSLPCASPPQASRHTANL